VRGKLKKKSKVISFLKFFVQSYNLIIRKGPILGGEGRAEIGKTSSLILAVNRRRSGKTKKPRETLSSNQSHSPPAKEKLKKKKAPH